MKSELQQVDVLIVGAGPTGLAVAIELRRRGISCLLIEKNNGPDRFSKAIGIHARPLEVLFNMGVAVDDGNLAVRQTALHVYNKQEQVFSLPFDELDTSFPYILNCPQHHLDEKMRERLTVLGGEVQFSNCLKGFEQHGTGVSAVISASGEERQVDAKWLVSCEGVDGIVRTALGFDSEHESDRASYLLADADIDWELANDAAYAFMGGDGLVMALPLHSSWRLMMPVPNSFSYEGSEDGDDFSSEPAKEALWGYLQDHLNQCLPDKVNIGNRRWLARFVAQKKMTNSFRLNRVFLAGDAAHSHNPVAAQGLNMGILDAYNLAWKLALVVKGRAAGGLLDSYEYERKQIVERMLSAPDIISSVAQTQNAFVRFMKKKTLNFAVRQKRVALRLMRHASMLDQHYRESDIVFDSKEKLLVHPKDGVVFGSELMAGDRAPNTELLSLRSNEVQRMHDLMNGGVHVLWIIAGEEYSELKDAKIFTLIERLLHDYGRELSVNVISVGAFEYRLDEFAGNIGRYLDSKLQVYQRYGSEACLYLVRPDGYIAYRSSLTEGHELLGYLEGVFTDFV